ncbi:hypothetical protein TNCV_61501 [Trichonephila clavipes]|nr:hypothetical protein TNCV_61501 [Trichonephila clavipes]
MKSSLGGGTLGVCTRAADTLGSALHISKRCLSPNHINNCSSSYSYFTCRANNKNALHNVLLCETKLAPPKEKIVSTLASEKVIQPSWEELTFEPNSRAIALASKKRGVS